MSKAITEAVWSVAIFLVVAICKAFPSRQKIDAVRAAFVLGRKVEQRRIQRRAVDVDDTTVRLW